MVYLSEEIDSTDLGRAAGLYVAGTALGATGGRIGVSMVSDWLSWHAAISLIDAFMLAAAIGFIVLLPP